MAISGQPGLYRFIAQGKNAIIVEHLETKIRSSAFSSARVSSLEEISIFTMEEDLPWERYSTVYMKKKTAVPPSITRLIRISLKRGLRRSCPNITKTKFM